MLVDGVTTGTSDEQRQLECDITALYEPFWRYARTQPRDQAAAVLGLDKPALKAYLLGALGDLPGARLCTLYVIEV